MVRVRRAVAALLALSTISAGPDQPTAMIGLGTDTCGAWLHTAEAWPALKTLGYLDWAQGYMSAMNLIRGGGPSRVLDLMNPGFPPSAQLAFLQQYCAQHPADRFVLAVLGLETQLAEHAPRPDVVVRGGGGGSP